MDALKRIKAAKQVTAADASDAGQALQWLQGIFGKGVPRERNGNQIVRWEKGPLVAELKLDTDFQGMSFWLSFKNDKREGIMSIEVEDASNFQKFKKAFAADVKMSMKELKDRRKEADAAIKLVDEAEALLHKLK